MEIIIVCNLDIFCCFKKLVYVNSDFHEIISLLIREFLQGLSYKIHALVNIA